MRCPRNAPRCDGPDGTRPKCAVCSEDKIKALILDLGKVVNERDAALLQLGEARKTAEYWKANHLAGNEEIERLMKALKALGQYIPANLDPRGEVTYQVFIPGSAIAPAWNILHGVTEKPECDCSVPAMEGAGQHSPSCAIFKNRVDATKPRLQRSEELCQPKNLFNDSKPKDPLIPCPRCGFFHGLDCVRPVRK